MAMKPRGLKYTSLVALLLLIGSGVYAQGYFWEAAKKEKKYKYMAVEAGLGLRMYSGDIQQKGSLFNPLKLAYGVGFRYQPRPRLGYGLHLAGRGYKGKAVQGGFPDAIDEMNGRLWEGTLMVQYSILKWEDFSRRMFTDRDPVTKGNLFIGVGVGGMLFNGSYTSRVYVAQTFTDSLGKETTVFNPLDRSGSGSGFAVQVPVVGGVRYRFTPSWYMSVELYQSFIFSDNIDGLERRANDGMTLMMVKAGYQFGQTKKKGAMGMTPNQRRKLKK